jgi:transposase
MKNFETQMKKDKIITLYKEKRSLREISKITNCPKSTIADLIKNYEKYGMTLRKNGSGRRPSLNDEDKKYILDLIDKNPKILSPKISISLRNMNNKDITPKTIRNYINSTSLSSYVVKNVPDLGENNRISRLNHCREWSNWPLKSWKRIIFSDETKINLFKSDGRARVWREPGTALQPKHVSLTRKFGGGSVMVWGCMGYNGVGRLTIIDGNVDSIKYKRILSQNLEESAEILGISDEFIFQQDNAPPHKAVNTMEYFDQNNITLLSWPPQSPDLNPIENLWSYLKQKVAERAPKTITDLKQKIQEEWEKIPVAYCQKLVKSMGNRIEGCIRNSGRWTEY